jgi:hypothetical protein
MEIKLIDGDFKVEDARELLIKLIEYKMNYHQSKIFSAQERNSKPGLHSIERIEDLKKSKETLKELLSKLESGTELSIYSTINIK